MAWNEIETEKVIAETRSVVRLDTRFFENEQPCITTRTERMNTSSFARIETLHRANYDTWKLQMQAVLMKNDAWEYVSGENVKPKLEAGNATSEAAVETWTKNDEKAKSDIVLSIKPSELKLIKGCTTSRKVWLKLTGTYQSKKPARKTTLLKKLTLHRMDESDDVQEHVR